MTSRCGTQPRGNNSSKPRSAVVFDVAKGVLEQISGKHAMFDIVARSEEGKESSSRSTAISANLAIAARGR